MIKINDFDTQIQSDEIIPRYLEDGSDWVNDWETDEPDDDDADCFVE